MLTLLRMRCAPSAPAEARRRVPPASKCGLLAALISRRKAIGLQAFRSYPTACMLPPVEIRTFLAADGRRAAWLTCHQSAVETHFRARQVGRYRFEICRNFQTKQQLIETQMIVKNPDVRLMYGTGSGFAQNRSVKRDAMHPARDRPDNSVRTVGSA